MKLELLTTTRMSSSSTTTKELSKRVSTAESTTWASAVSERTTARTGTLWIHWIFACVESCAEVGVGENFVGFVYGCHG